VYSLPYPPEFAHVNASVMNVWVEIPTFDGLNLLIENHYFPPNTKPEIIANYFHVLENK
jgi:hypothetical protein